MNEEGEIFNQGEPYDAVSHHDQMQEPDEGVELGFEDHADDMQNIFPLTQAQPERI